jgi:hypothetical protein
VIVVNYGGGTNSTALLVEAHRRKLRPDIIVFADTGDEMPHTYAFLNEMDAWCARVGFPPISRVRWIRRDGSFVSLEQFSLRSASLPSKAYGMSGCTAKWKQQPIDKFIKHHQLVHAAWKKIGFVERWIGYDADEPARATRMIDKNPQPTGRGVPPYAKYRWRAPLIDWDMGRDECIEAIDAAGLPRPGKSSCFFCPSMKKHEIDQLREEHPELLERALKIEDTAREGLRGSIKGLGRNFSWREYLDRKPEACEARETVEEACGCYDGES